MPIHCPYHPPKPETTEYLSAFALRTLQATPRATPRTILGQEIPPVRDYPYRVSVPQELHDTMSRTVAYALDFILDTLDFSPDETTPPANENDLRAQLSGDPTQRDQSRDQFSLVLWNDDKHSFEELVLLLCDLSNRTREEASVAVDRIDEQGREVIETNSNATRLLEMAQTISQIDLGATLRRAYDTFREQVVAVIIEWLLDLTRSRLATDTLILREVIAAELLNPRRHYAYMPTHDVGKVLSDINDPSRIDWMFLYHTRLWKKPRLN